MNWVTNYVARNHFIAAILVVLFGWLLFEIREILVALFFSFILMAGLSPLVEILVRKKIPRTLAVVVTFSMTVLFVVLLIIPLIPFFVAQVQALFARFPFYVDRAAALFGFQVDAKVIHDFITAEFATIGKSAFSVTTKVFSGLFSVLTILVVSFYLLFDREQVQEGVAALFPKSLQKKVLETMQHIEEKLGAWLRGQILLSLFIGVLTWVVLTILGLDFALPLAVLAGILEIVPTLGPIISAVPAIIVAFTISPTLAIAVVVAYLVIQAIENNVLVPKIMEKAVGLHPIVIIISIMVGARLMGVVGALLAIPFISMLTIIARAIRSS